VNRDLSFERPVKTGRFQACLAAMLLCALGASGCYELGTRPAVSLAELPAAGDGGPPGGFTDSTVEMYNLARVLDPDLDAADRLESLLLVQRIDPEAQRSADALATVLDRTDENERVQLAVLRVLARADSPHLRSGAVRALARARDPRLRQALLDWLTRHPRAEVLD